MKTMTKIRMTFLMVTLAITVPTFANPTFLTDPPVSSTNTPPSPEAKAEAELLIKRLEEIKAMDKSKLSRAEKRALRKEVKEIKATLRSTGNGVYLSVGAIIIIVLLLILLV